MARRVTLLDNKDLKRIQVLVDIIYSQIGDIEEKLNTIEEILEDSQNVEGPN